MRNQCISRHGMIQVIVMLLVSFWVPAIYAQDYSFGDIPLDNETYQSNIKVWSDDVVDTLPSNYDARDDGIVTTPKNQESCGSCWAFASVGAYESHLIKQFNTSPQDLSEQQQVSCNLNMSGCCGGSSTALQFWATQGAILESCGSYGDGGTSCPTIRTVFCDNISGCAQLPNLVTNFHTISNDPDQMKASLYNDGPSYWRFDVYSDFSTFWRNAAAGTVYQNSSNTTRQGGHAVLLIGWDDAKQAYLCKNSWGATGGPQGDGTFWISYDGHYNNLGFQMANFTLSGEAPGDCSLELDLSYSSNNLNINLDIGTSEAASLNLWISFLNEVIPLIPGVGLPALNPPINIPISIPNFPHLGNIGALTTLTTADGITCSDWDMVDTGPIQVTEDQAIDQLSNMLE